MKTITVQFKTQFGQTTIVPVCSDAQLFADIAGTKTLTKPTLANIKALGYAIEAKQEHKDINSFIG